MAQYINKADIISEIENIESSALCEYKSNKSRYAEGSLDVVHRIRHFLNTLEVKELNLEKNIDLDAIIDEYMDKNFGESWDGARPVGSFELITMAEYFFELGLKAQKGE